MAVKFNDAAIGALSRSKLTAGLRRAALWAEGEVKRSFQPGTGRTYMRGKVKHVASVPGQPPAVDTGRLRASITHEVVTEGSKTIARIGTSAAEISGKRRDKRAKKVNYAKELEFGTRHKAARPFLRPILARKAELLDQFVKGARKG